MIVLLEISAGSEAAKRKRKRRKSKKGGEVVLKPPKRVPITYEEQVNYFHSTNTDFANFYDLYQRW